MGLACLPQWFADVNKNNQSTVSQTPAVQRLLVKTSHKNVGENLDGDNS